MKRICSILLVLMLFVSTVVTVLAEGDFPPSEQPTTRWWPGNPNPQPGIEDWFFQNQNYGSNAPIAFSRDCAMQALKDALIPGGTAEAINYWLLKKAFSVGSFGVGFGVGYMYSYGACLMSKGVSIW